MSTVSLNAGDTSWQDSITCDFCGKTEERKGTGEMKRVPLSISDPRSRAPWSGEPLPEIEYEERAWTNQNLENVWGHFRVDTPLLDSQRVMDLCPTCASVMADAFLEKSRTGGWGTSSEVKYGTEVPGRPLEIFTAQVGRATTSSSNQIFTNLSRVADLGRESLGILGPPIGAGGPCLWRTGGSLMDICGQPSMAGQNYCYRHAAQERR